MVAEELQLLVLTWMDNKVQQLEAMEMEMEWQPPPNMCVGWIGLVGRVWLVWFFTPPPLNQHISNP